MWSLLSRGQGGAGTGLVEGEKGEVGTDLVERKQGGAGTGLVAGDGGAGPVLWKEGREGQVLVLWEGD